jgi:uncharacterized protein YegP (UPF0339 family)
VGWYVYDDAMGKWHWELVDAKENVLARSSGGFDSRDECLADAKKSGYAGEHEGPKDPGSG